jgi:hypothetical protein
MNNNLKQSTNSNTHYVLLLIVTTREIFLRYFLEHNRIFFLEKNNIKKREKNVMTLNREPLTRDH